MKLSYDPSRCAECGLCFSVCPEVPTPPESTRALKFSELLAKCTLCAGFRKPRCVNACPHDALRIEHDAAEQQELLRIVGWTKTKPSAATQTLEERGSYSVARDGTSRFLFTRIEPPGLEEARLAEQVLEKLRKSSEPYTPQSGLRVLRETCAACNLALSEKQEAKIASFVESETTGFSVLDFFLKLPVEEIVVTNEKTPLFVYHEQFGWLETDVTINNKQKIADLANKIARSAGRRLSFKTPTVSAHASFGRLHAAIPPAAASGPCITIRKHRQKPFSLKDFVKNKTLSPEAAAFLKLAAQADLNILIIGNTASGKTSFLNTLAGFVPANQRIIIVEETPEVNLPHKNQVRLVAPDNNQLHNLIADTLRMRPDRLVVGEVRTAPEAKALANCLLAGQGKGMFATMHAESAQEALRRLEFFGLENTEISAIDLIVCVKRSTRGGADSRRVTEITSKTNTGLSKLYDYNHQADSLQKRALEGPVIDKIMRGLGCDSRGFIKILEKEGRCF